MKKAVSILLILLLSSYTTQINQKNDLTKENLKGNVKSVRGFSFFAVEESGEFSKGERGEINYFNYYYKKYDDKGYIIELNKFWSDGSLKDKTTYEYDNKGNKIVSNMYNANIGHVVVFKSTHEYGDNGNEIKLNRYKEGGGLYKNSYKYNNKGNIIEDNSFKADGSLSFKIIYKYDDKGNLTEEYPENGNEEEKTTFKYDYDKSNNWIERIEFKNDRPIFILEREIEYY